MIRPIALALMWLFILWGGFGLLVMAVNDRKAERAERERNQRRALGNKGVAR